MDSCDVAIVGGGPAGSSCAWQLRRAGLDVVVVDQASFPRDKVCAGWITPPVLDALAIDVDEYRRGGRTFQPITGFAVGLVGGDDTVAASYSRPVSFGIRRCQFDDYLLRRSRARLRTGARVRTIRRDGACWIVNEAIRAPMLVGAGGHFCPVARMLNGSAPAWDSPRLVAAQETEVPVAPGTCAIDPETPELFFARDLSGYGWCFRKGEYVNIGFGRLGRAALPRLTAELLAFLRETGRIAGSADSWRWRGHGYLVSGSPRRRTAADGVVLVGDAAGLAYPQSGEGIRPAIESGLMAAAAVLEANGDYSARRLKPYASRLDRQFGERPIPRLLSKCVPSSLPARLGPRLLSSPWFVRDVVLDRWFLHAR